MFRKLACKFSKRPIRNSGPLRPPVDRVPNSVVIITCLSAVIILLIVAYGIYSIFTGYI